MTCKQVEIRKRTNITNVLTKTIVILASSRDPNTKFICLFKFLPTFVKLIQSFQIFNQRSCQTQVSPLHILTSENDNQIQNDIVISPYSRERFSSFSILFLFYISVFTHPTPSLSLISLNFFVGECKLVLVSILMYIFITFFDCFWHGCLPDCPNFPFCVIYQVVCVNWNSW